MPTMNISLPDSMKQYVEDQVAMGDYSSASEYVRELVRIDQRRHAKDALERSLIQAIAEGGAAEADDAWWTSLRNDVAKIARLPKARRRS
jgi:antitoxin ParD1/3/4